MNKKMDKAKALLIKKDKKGLAKKFAERWA